MAAIKRKYYLVLDLGTTGVKGIIFDAKLKLVAQTYLSLRKSTDGKSRVEQDPEELVAKGIAVLRKVVKARGLKKGDIAGFGLTNQRETVILWDKATGKAAYPAIVWQDNRTQEYCDRMRKRNEKTVMEKTGLPILPYFSASKIKWVLDNVSRAAALGKKKQLAIGTVDSWFLWNVTAEHVHATDYTNASRTLLFNIKNLKWDKDLSRIFKIPNEALPRALPSRSNFGELDPRILGFGVPILAICGDQQASLFAAGTARGTAKVTYGTGAFFMQILGPKYAIEKGFFTTIAVSGKTPVFAIEGKVNKGALDVLKVLKQPAALRRVITSIAEEVGKITDKLDPRPKELIIDGGITKYRPLPAIQRKISKMRVKRQSVPNGTALGVAKLMAGR
jgi:glycerol kinase